MTEDVRGRGYALPHIVVEGTATSLAFRGKGGGNTVLRPIENRREQAQGLVHELEAAQASCKAASDELPVEVRSDGLILAFEAWPGFELALESLDLRSAGIELLVVQPAFGDPPRQLASVFVPYDKTDEFVRRLQEFADHDTPKGRPKNQRLVANIANIRLAVLQALWTDVAPFPDAKEPIWWEVWLRRNPDTLEALEQIVAALQWEKASHWVMFPDRIVTAVLADVASLTKALGTRLPIAEIRHARFAESPAELPLDYQRDLSADLADRVAPCSDDGPSVCLLDTGGYRHTLLASSLSNDDMHYVVGTDAYDRRGHGTRMAGLALYGSLEEALGTLGPVALDHRLESVKIFPDPNTPPNAPDTYGFVTAAGALVAEQVRPDRRRAYCMAVTADGDSDGRPTLWSATLDALTFGTDVTKTDRGIELLTEPEPDKSRLFVVPAGNVDQQDYCRDYLTACDSHAVLDPAQSWNALTVGGFTKLVGVPAGRDFVGYSALAASGSLSPFSRTSRRFASKWPIKPEIVLEAGNLLISRGDPPSIYEHDVVSIVTTSLEEQVGRNPLGTISMTSAATAQAARLAAVASGHYPDLWPETIRGLLVHSAEWTGPMWNEVRPPATKTQRAELLKRYGYGVPTEERVLHSASNAVTLICQDWIQPYERDDGRTRLAQLRVHELPWPARELLDLQDAEVRIKVTLSYFVEPNPSSRLWKQRYAYRSHGLRFAVRQAGETDTQFRRRVGKETATDDDSDGVEDTAEERHWLIGAAARNRGSIHSDVYTTTAADLSDSGAIGVFPVGGWWKSGTRHDRAERRVRYALLVSLTTPRTDIDLYTPIAIKIGLPVEITG
jgi:hypothetical protein